MTISVDTVKSSSGQKQKKQKTHKTEENANKMTQTKQNLFFKFFFISRFKKYIALSFITIMQSFTIMWLCYNTFSVIWHVYNDKQLNHGNDTACVLKQLNIWRRYLRKTKTKQKWNKRKQIINWICFDLICGILSPLSAIFQLFHGDQF
jgi:hypothetical protein